MAKQSFPISSFTDLSGSPLSSGYLQLCISTDVQSPTGQIGHRQVFTVPLDTNGIIIGNPTFWDNGSLLPSGSVYILYAYSSTGQFVLGPVPVTITAEVISGFGLSFGTYFGS